MGRFMPFEATHGASALEKRIETNRLTSRERRSIARRDRALEVDCAGAAAAMFRRRIATREEVIRRLEVHIVANPDASIDDKWLVALWNQQRRDTEVLVLLDAQRRSAPEMTPCPRCRVAFAPTEYMTHDCTPSPDAAPTTASQPAAVPTTVAGPAEDTDA